MLDLRTVSVDNVLDLSFIITELYWVTDMALIQRLSTSPVHSQGYELRETKSAHWLQRDEEYQISCSFWSFGFAFKCCLCSPTNVCWLLLLVSHNFITLAQWKLGVRASVVTADGYCFILTLTYRRSENTGTHICFMCQNAVPSINPQQGLKDEWFAGSTVMLTWKSLYLQLCWDERLCRYWCP